MKEKIEDRRLSNETETKQNNDGMPKAFCIIAICLAFISIILSVVSLTRYFNTNNEPQSESLPISQSAAKQGTETQTLVVNESEYDIKLDSENCDSIYVMPYSGSGFYVKELYIKNLVCWYVKNNGEVCYRLLDSCLITVVYK